MYERLKSTQENINDPDLVCHDEGRRISTSLQLLGGNIDVVP